MYIKGFYIIAYEDVHCYNSNSKKKKMYVLDDEVLIIIIYLFLAFQMMKFVLVRKERVRAIICQVSITSLMANI